MLVFTLSSAHALSCAPPSFDVDLDAVPNNGVLAVAHAYGPPTEILLESGGSPIQFEIQSTPRTTLIRPTSPLETGGLYTLTLDEISRDFEPVEALILDPPPTPIVLSVNRKDQTNFDGDPKDYLQLKVEESAGVVLYETELTNLDTMAPPDFALSDLAIINLGYGLECGIATSPNYTPRGNYSMRVRALGPTGLTSDWVDASPNNGIGCSTAPLPGAVTWAGLLLLAVSTRRTRA